MSDTQHLPAYLEKSDQLMLGALTKSINSYLPSELDLLGEAIKWGTYGPNGTDKLKVKVLNDLDTEHLENILVTQSHAGPLHKKVILHLIKKRLCEEKS